MIDKKSEAALRLEQEVAEYKKRKEAADKKKEHAIQATDPKPMADIVPEVMAGFNRIHTLAEQFAKDIKTQADKVAHRPCPIHESEFMEIDLDATMVASRMTRGKFIPKWKPCHLCRHQNLVNERHGQWIRMGVPNKVAHATFDNFNAETPEQIEVLEKAKDRFLRSSGFLLLLGTHGTGKSHLAAAVLKRVGNGRFITHEELVGELRRTYEDGGREKMMEKYQKAPCLVLDEIIPKMKGDDIEPMLYRILAYRYDRDLITVLTSNEGLASLLEILGKKLEDRMAQNYTVAFFKWNSYRRTHREV